MDVKILKSMEWETAIRNKRQAESFGIDARVVERGDGDAFTSGGWTVVFHLRDDPGDPSGVDSLEMKLFIIECLRYAEMAVEVHMAEVPERARSGELTTLCIRFDHGACNWPECRCQCHPEVKI